MFQLVENIASKDRAKVAPFRRAFVNLSDPLIAAADDRAAGRCFEQSYVDGRLAISRPLAAIDMVLVEAKRTNANHIQIGPPAAPLQKQPIPEWIGERRRAAFPRPAAIDEDLAGGQDFDCRDYGGPLRNIGDRAKGVQMHRMAMAQ